MERKPIKRSKYLIELSKDHHVSLLFCWKIREGIRKGAALSRINKYINFFWEQHLKEHFKEEEELLFNQIQHPLCEQGKAEHIMLAERLNRLNRIASDAEEEYILFEDLLNKHVRFEERVLFPSLETLLPESVLKSACEQLLLKHATPYRDDYADEFWTKTSDE